MKGKDLILKLQIRSAFLIALTTGAIIFSTALFPNTRPFFVLAAIAALIILDRDSTDKLLLLAVGILGLAPTLGWVRMLNESIDVVTLFAALSLSSSVFALSRKTVWLNRSAIPATIAGMVTFLWWRPIASGSSSDLLARMMLGWDHFGHYYLFVSAKVHHEFVALLPSNILNSTLYDKKYPAGIHMSWAQWWRDMGPELIKHPSAAMHQYLVSVVITTAICTALIVLAIARVAEKHWVRMLSATGATFLFLAFVCFGHLSMTIWSGFPNFIVAITGTIIVCSVSIKRTDSAWRTVFVLAGASAMITYNWFPLILPVVPIAVFAIWKESKQLVKNSRLIFFGILSILGILIATPAIQAMAFGAKHIALPGGINYLPIQSVVMVLLVGVTIGLIEFSRNFTIVGFLKASPLFIAGAFQILVTIPIRLKDGTYPYYPQKIAYGMVFIVLATSCILIIQWLDAKWSTESFKKRFMQGLALLVGCAAFAQIFGYVGADWSVIAGGNVAPGIPTRKSVLVNASRISNLVLSLEEATRYLTPPDRDCLVLDDTEMQEYDPVLVNYWVGTLTWTLTEEHISRAQELVPIRTGQVDPALNAQVLNNLLSPATDCPVITRPVASALTTINPQWASKLWVIESDGHITKFMMKD